jgi:hypothetical protein
MVAAALLIVEHVEQEKTALIISVNLPVLLPQNVRMGLIAVKRTMVAVTLLIVEYVVQERTLVLITSALMITSRKSLLNIAKRSRRTPRMLLKG